MRTFDVMTLAPGLGRTFIDQPTLSSNPTVTPSVSASAPASQAVWSLNSVSARDGAASESGARRASTPTARVIRPQTHEGPSRSTRSVGFAGSLAPDDTEV